MLVASHSFEGSQSQQVCAWFQLLTRSLLFQTNPYSAMRGEAGGGGGAAGGGGGGSDMDSWGAAGALPPSAASYYSYDHPSLAAYRYVSLSSKQRNYFKLI